jgi:GNAT superfamily N-acetyltransferase
MISIRKSTREDIPVLADFQLRLADETENVKLDRSLVVKGLESLFGDPSKGQYFTALYNDEIAGCHLITYEWSEWRNSNVWWLQSVYVKESHRKHGIFRAMYANLLTLIENDPDVNGLRLYVDKTNSRAQEVYKSLGMNGEHYTVFEWMKS